MSILNNDEFLSKQRKPSYELDIFYITSLLDIENKFIYYLGQLLHNGYNGNRKEKAQLIKEAWISFIDKRINEWEEEQNV